MSVNKQAEPIRIETDKMIKKVDQWEKAEAAAGQAAGTRREAIGKFVEDAGLHNKAFSHFRTARKIKDDGKKRHYLRTMQALIPVLEAELDAQDQMDLDEPEDNVVKMQDAAKAADAEMDEIETEEAEFDAAADDLDLAQPAE